MNAPGAIIGNTDALVIPAMTFNTVAKAVCGIADTPASSVMLHALLRGIPIIAADDACNPQLIAGGVKNQMFYNRLMRNVNELKQYGVQMTSTCKLSEQVNRFFAGGICRSEKTPDTPCTALNADHVFQNRVLCEKNIDEFKGKELVVGKNTLITMAAGERAQKRGILIVKES
jgi:hypothetical protein